jgi:hypothetical protein
MAMSKGHGGLSKNRKRRNQEAPMASAKNIQFQKARVLRLSGSMVEPERKKSNRNVIFVRIFFYVL